MDEIVPRAFIETFTGIDMHSLVKGHDKHIRVLSFDMGVDGHLRDGVAAGRHTYRPLRLTFEIDVETPMLLDALSKNAELKEVVVKFYRHQGAKWDVYGTFTFKQVHVESMQLHYGEADALQTMLVTMQLVYGQIDVDVNKKKFADQVFDLPTRA